MITSMDKDKEEGYIPKGENKRGGERF